MLSFTIFSRHDDQTASRLPIRRRKLLLEDLEGRQLLSVFTVTNTYDSGTGQPPASDRLVERNDRLFEQFDHLRHRHRWNADDPPEIGVAGRLTGSDRRYDTGRYRHRPTHCFEWSQARGRRRRGSSSPPWLHGQGSRDRQLRLRGRRAERGFRRLDHG